MWEGKDKIFLVQNAKLLNILITQYSQSFKLHFSKSGLALKGHTKLRLKI